MSVPSRNGQPALAAIAETAARLSRATEALVYRREGDQLRLVARHGSPRTRKASGDVHPIDRRTTLGRAILDGRTSRAGAAVATPMLRDGAPVGAIAVRRVKARPFSNEQIGLLEVFAGLAAVAIGELDARDRELVESLEQQAATGAILRVISSSPTDVQPVFDAIARNVVRLCDAAYSVIGRYDGQLLHLVSHAHVRAEGVEALQQLFPMRPSRATTTGRAILDRTVVHVPDALEDPEYARPVALAIQNRSTLAVPMLRDGEPIGTISVGRLEPRPFTEKQIELLKTFADQAVIAIENVRLFRELEARNGALTEALDQQTATAEILRVISRSPNDVQPVFDIIGTSAKTLCDAEISVVSRFDGELIHLVSLHGVTPEGVEAVRDAFPMRPDTGSVSARAVRARAVVHVPDVLTDPDYERKDAARASGYRGCLGVPMVREGQVIGAIFVAQRRPGLFADTQVELLKTFADQAVIAVENVRLFTELQARNRELTETLEQQTATGEILRAISSSPTDAQPVFDTIARSAMRLCEGSFAVVSRYDGAFLHLAAHAHATAEGVDVMRQIFPTRPSRINLVGRVILTGAVVHVPDVQADAEYNPALSQTLGNRSSIAVPMLRDGQPIGAIMVGRLEVRPFSDTHMALLKTFADQAVIAIENVRLFTELEARNQDLTEALEQQTATGEILKVISGAQTDAQPVFDTIVKSVVRLCDGVFTTVFRFDGSVIYPVAHHHTVTSAGLEVFERVYPMPPGRASVVARAVLDRAVVHVLDVDSDAEIPPASRELARAVGYRSILGVPMLRDGNPIGAIGVGRRAVNGQARPFTDKEIALLQTFADQAVIAIENVRLFKELEAKNRDLTETLEQQTATGEILRVISSSPTDVQPVFDTIAQSARQLCEAQFCAPLPVRWQAAPLRGPPWTHARGGRGRAARLSHRAGPGQCGRPGGPQWRRRAHPGRPRGPGLRASARSPGSSAFRSIVAVPMLRDGVPDRGDRGCAIPGRTLPRPADRPAQDLRRPGGDRDRERPALPGAGGPEPRPDRDAGAADGDRRDPARHLELADRRPAGVRVDRRQRGQALRRLVRRGAALRRRAHARRGGAQRGAGAAGRLPPPFPHAPDRGHCHWTRDSGAGDRPLRGRSTGAVQPAAGGRRSGSRVPSLAGGAHAA